MTDSTEVAPLPTDSGVTGQTTGTTVVQAEKPQLVRLGLGEAISGLAAAPARHIREAFALMGQLVTTTLAETKAELVETRVKLDAQREENTTLKIKNAELARDVRGQRDARRIGNLLVLLGGLLMKLGSDHLATPELGGTILLVGVAVIVGGFMMKPKDAS